MSNKINKIYLSSNNVKDFAKDYLLYLSELFDGLDYSKIEKFSNTIDLMRKKGKTIFVAGNGGSATTASTIANDLGFDIIKKTKTKIPFKIMSLTDNNGVMTAISNDVGYESLFENQLKIHYQKGDCLIVISASGNSENLIRAVRWVNQNKGITMGLLGFDGGKLLNLCDTSILVNTKSGEYGPVEDIHLVINHILAHWFQNKLKKS